MRLWSALAAVGVLTLGLVLPRAEAAAPFGTDSCPGVSPGALLHDPGNNFYTMGFFLKGVKGKDKATYFATIGDLLLPVAGTKTWTGSSGPAVRDRSNKEIGHFAYAYRQDTPAADSFGLVRVNPKVKTSAGVCHFGGPTGIYSTESPAPFAVQFYGQGLPFVDVVPARTGIAIGSASKDQIFLVGPAGSFGGLGDEGGPILANGQAVGIFTGAAGGGGNGVGFAVSRLRPALDRAQKATGIRMTLLTSSAL
jgi:hypothetical protein